MEWTYNINHATKATEKERTKAYQNPQHPVVHVHSQIPTWYSNNPWCSWKLIDIICKKTVGLNRLWNHIGQWICGSLATWVACDLVSRLGLATRFCYQLTMMTSSNGNLFRVTGHLCGEFTGPRWIPHTKASDAELWCLLWSASE